MKKPNESRRGFIRVDFEAGSQVDIKGSGGEASEVSYDALDLSVYGLSFLASPEDFVRFVVGRPIPLLAFVVDGRRISVSGRVASVRTGLIKGLARVAIEFTNILVEDVWFLARYVANKAGVTKPHQLGSGMLELKELRQKAAKRPSSRLGRKAGRQAKAKKKREPGSRAKPRKTSRKGSAKKAGKK